MSILLRSGARSRRAASLTSRISLLAGAVTVSETAASAMTGSGAGGRGVVIGTGVGVGAAMGGIGIVAGVALRGAAGRGAGLMPPIGPTWALILPLSPSGMDDGAATGSEKTGSALVFFVISSIAFCKSLSTVGFIFPPL